jgi:hypothetical protein
MLANMRQICSPLQPLDEPAQTPEATLMALQVGQPLYKTVDKIRKAVAWSIIIGTYVHDNLQNRHIGIEIRTSQHAYVMDHNAMSFHVHPLHRAAITAPNESSCSEVQNTTSTAEHTWLGLKTCHHKPYRKLVNIPD